MLNRTLSHGRGLEAEPLDQFGDRARRAHILSAAPRCRRLGILEIIYLFGFAKLTRAALFSRAGR